MKPARSIVPGIDQTVDEANGQRVAVVGGAARAITATVPRGGGSGAPASARRASADPVSNRKTAEGAGREGNGDAFHSITMSTPGQEVPTRDRNMARTMLIRTTSLAALIATFGLLAVNPTAASDPRAGDARAAAAGNAQASAQPSAPAQGGAQGGAQGIELVGSDLNARFISLGVGKSMVLDLPRDIKDVLIADPKIANAVVRSSRRAYIIGAAVGQTNIFFFDAEGRQIGGFDIAVKRDLNGIRSAIKQALPAADIQVEAVGDSIMLTGNVATTAESQMAFDIATRLLASGTSIITAEGSKVVNAITVHSRDQVMLKVTVAEVKRTIIKQLGIDLNGSFGYGSAVLNLNTSNAFPISVPPTDTLALGTKSVTATLRALEQAGVTRVLAEPTLTAISGESANFIAGGKFPYPTPPAQAGAGPGYAWQTFGVSLTFTPVVLSEGRISLKVTTEVSELAPENSVTIAGTTVPGITTRDVDTTLEIPSGGSLAMAGMIQEQTKQSITGLPGLMQLPILGTLFKSRDYLNNQTELMVIVTPYVVRSVARKDLSRPDDGFADSSDPAAVLLGSINRIYGVPGNADPKRTYRGNYGFILD